MILFILGLIIGSIGGMIMMAMFLTGKTRESSFCERLNMRNASRTFTSGAEDNDAENR